LLSNTLKHNNSLVDNKKIIDVLRSQRIIYERPALPSNLNVFNGHNNLALTMLVRLIPAISYCEK
jgi:hypothetical protein